MMPVDSEQFPPMLGDRDDTLRKGDMEGDKSSSDSDVETEGDPGVILYNPKAIDRCGFIFCLLWCLP